MNVSFNATGFDPRAITISSPSACLRNQPRELRLRLVNDDGFYLRPTSLANLCWRMQQPMVTEGEVRGLCEGRALPESLDVVLIENRVGA
jgi:hypothetical protein